jgi:Na+/H+-dicarboxylate symporter
MKLTETLFENVVLHMLFLACMVVCGLILTAMVTSKPAPVQLARAMTLSNPVSTLLASAPSACTLPVTNMICQRAAG